MAAGQTPGMSKVDLPEKLAVIKEHWSPRTIGDLNDYEIKVVKVQGALT